MLLASLPSDTVLLRFGVAFVFAFAFGLARQRLGKPVGFGTFIFVALGSCALALIAQELHGDNPLPMLAAIITGVGFLGAGALLRTQDRVSGFTTAATIWIFAVFGLAVGVGEFRMGALVYGTVVLVAAIDHVLQHRWLGAHKRRLTVALRMPEAQAVSHERLGLPPRETAEVIEIDRELGVVVLTFRVDRSTGLAQEWLERLVAEPAVHRVHLE